MAGIVCFSYKAFVILIHVLHTPRAAVPWFQVSALSELMSQSAPVTTRCNQTCEDFTPFLSQKDVGQLKDAAINIDLKVDIMVSRCVPWAKLQDACILDMNISTEQVITCSWANCVIRLGAARQILRHGLSVQELYSDWLSVTFGFPPTPVAKKKNMLAFGV